jgi:hypothetical protein
MTIRPFAPVYDPAKHWRPGCGLCKRYRTAAKAASHGPSRYAQELTRPGEFWQVFRCERCQGWHQAKITPYEHPGKK